MQQRAGVAVRALSLAGLVLVSTLVGSGGQVTPVVAQQAPSGAVAGGLTRAAAGLGPIPTKAILPPHTLERIARRMRRQRWTMPAEDESWPITHGQPVVNTPQVDELWHTVEPGEDLGRIRRMFKVSRSDLRKLNPDTPLGDLDIGQRLLVWQRDADTFARSYGATNWGRLVHGEPLPDDDHYVILYPHRTFGTYYTVSEVKRVLDDYYSWYPDARKLIIGDISYRRGRSMAPHKSHRSGRDIDISYPRLNAPPTYRRFHRLRRRNLDVQQTLALIKDFLDGGYVEYIFMNRWYQKKLRREALAQGAPKRWVEAVFQYPDFHGGTAIIRHAPGHRNHFHVRFQCQPTDRQCE